MPPISLPSFSGKVYLRGERDYAEHRYQYATSSEGMTGDMQPLAIIYPNGVQDLQAAVTYASANNIAIAVRTGGHQYSGASSTDGPNIQLDLSTTFRDDFHLDPQTGLVEIGVSHSLLRFNEKLGALGLSVPHGQCSHVHLGGHAQTGGYGSFTRAFGLFADRIEGLKLVDATGTHRQVNRNTQNPADRDLFFGVLGGSPGNFGILTHLIVKPIRDGDHPNSRGLKRLTLYSPERMQALLDLMVDFADDVTMPAGFDFSVTMMSASNLLLPELWPGLDEVMRTRFPNIFGRNDIPLWPAFIIVYAQWSDLPSERGQYDPSWFQQIKDAMGPSLPTILSATMIDSFEGPKKLSELARAWIYTNVREFPLPYIKRAYSTNSTTLKQNGWAAWAANRIQEIEAPLFNGCKLATQFFYWGGNNSRLVTLADANSAYSWRTDTKICQIMDCFYDQPSIFGDPFQTATDWQLTNDAQGIGPNGKFCQSDRRYFWGSFGDKVLDNAWQHYFEDQAKYNKLKLIKSQCDPSGVFTPNPFCVGAPAPAPGVMVAPVAGLSLPPLSGNALNPVDYDAKMLVALQVREAREDRESG